MELQAVFIGLFLLLLVPLESLAQRNRLINAHNWQYDYIKRLQQRGYLLRLNPTDLPYTFGDISKALAKIDPSELNQLEKRWYKMLRKSFSPRPTNIDSMRVGGLFGTALRHSGSARLNVINPQGDGKAVLPRARLNAYLEWGKWIGQAGLTFDWFYDVDPVGLDVARRLYTRSEDVYFGYNGEKLKVYLGRFDDQWSVYGRKGSFLTDNPRSFDQIKLTFGTPKLSFSSILGEMDNMNSDGSFTGRAFGSGAVRRYIFFHRLDWSPISNLKLTFIEAELYFSKTAGISIRNLIPLHFLFFESYNKPMNNNSNIMLGPSFWYHTGIWTFFLQGMLDDVDIKSEDPEGTPKYPTSFALNSSITASGLFNRFDLGLEVDMVASNAYRSGRYQDQWTYAQRGLATNFSDFIRTEAYGAFYPRWLAGMTIKPALTFYWKGTQDLRDLRSPTLPDGSPMPVILAGPVERTVRPSLHIRYQPMGTTLFDPSRDIRFNFWLDADMGVNFTANADHQEGVSNRRFIGLFRANAQITF
jgi:hypothetical protein